MIKITLTELYPSSPVEVKIVQSDSLGLIQTQIDFLATPLEYALDEVKNVVKILLSNQEMKSNVTKTLEDLAKEE